MRRAITYLLILSFLLPATMIRGEAIDDEFTQISPKHAPGAGEFVHGQGYGKILIRILVFGAVSSQGVHYIPEGTDLLFAMLYAGGYSDNTKMSAISIRRKGMPETIVVDLESIIEEGGPIPKLKDGDVLNVPFNWRKDYQEFMFFAGIFSSLTALVLSMALLTR